LSLPPPDHFLVVEPNPELRRIIIAEIEEATGARATGAGPDECTNAELLSGAAPVAMFSQAKVVRAALPGDTYLITLRARSVSESLKGEKPPRVDALIAIVSSWPEFLNLAHTMLVAAGVDPNALSVRDARKQGWERGLSSTAVVITDSLAARQLPDGCPARVFRVISDPSVAELRAHVEQFFR
jgi:GntR family transcriptional regulator